MRSRDWFLDKANDHISEPLRRPPKVSEQEGTPSGILSVRALVHTLGYRGEGSQRSTA